MAKAPKKKAAKAPAPKSFIEKADEFAAAIPEKPAPKLVRMKRGGKVRFVQPNEVDAFKGGGWKVG